MTNPLDQASQYPLTTMNEWARHEPFRVALQATLKTEHMRSALNILYHTNPPRAAVSPDAVAVALTNQYQAGWYAALQALQALANYDPTKAKLKDRAVEIESQGHWSHAGHSQSNSFTQ